jgi:glycerate kinase
VSAAVGMDLLAGEPDPVEALADSAYGTGQMLDAAQQGGHTSIIVATARRGRGRVHHR